MDEEQSRRNVRIISKEDADFLRELDTRPPQPTEALKQAGEDLRKWREEHPDAKW